MQQRTRTEGWGSAGCSESENAAGVSREEDAHGRAALELEAQILAERKAHLTDGTGYQAIQGTKPQTLGYGLNDSPSGLAAWMQWMSNTIWSLSLIGQQKKPHPAIATQ